MELTKRDLVYKSALCWHFAETGTCPHGENCDFAHGEEDLRQDLRALVRTDSDGASRAIVDHLAEVLRIHPLEKDIVLRLVTREVAAAVDLCSSGLAGVGLDLSVRDLLYKTALCQRYTQYGECPYGVRCRYAHGEEERRPQLRALISEDKARGFDTIVQHLAQMLRTPYPGRSKASEHRIYQLRRVAQEVLVVFDQGRLTREVEEAGLGS
jgi:hypothetical protein